MKFISYAKNLSLATIAFLSLSACAPEEKNINIKELIPQDAKIAFYFESNPKVINELKAKKEYAEISAALKAKNQELEALYTKFSQNLPVEQRKIIELLINPKDIIGSFEDILANQDISLAYSQGAIMESLMHGKSPSLLLSFKLSDKNIASNLEKALSLIPQISKAQIQGYPLFEMKKVQDDLDLFISKANDAFLITLSKEMLNDALGKIETPAKSILDNQDFKAVVANPNSDAFAYVDISDIAKLLAIVEPKINISSLKSAGLEAKTLSLSEGLFALKLNFADDKYLSSLKFNSFKESSLPKNIYQDSVLYASLAIPTQDSIASIAKLLGFGQYAAILKQMNINLKVADIAFERQDFETFDKAPKALVNAYLEDSAHAIKMLGLSNPKEIDGVKIYSPSEEVSIALISKERISFLHSKNLKESIDVATSNKLNAEIKSKLDEISLENCVAEVYIDAKFFQELNDSQNADAINILPFEPLKILAEKSSNLYEENSLVAKLGVKGNTLSLLAKTKSKINFSVAKEIILELLK